VRASVVVPEFGYRLFVDLNLFVALARSAVRRKSQLVW